MIEPFEIAGDRLRLRLQGVERMLLGAVPRLLDEGDDAGGRLDYTAHPDDPGAEARYRELVAGDLDALRREDRTGFELVRTGEPATADEIAAFMRVVGEARLVLAARLGIEEEGWELEQPPDDPEMAMLGWLGHLQEAAIRGLGEL